MLLKLFLFSISPVLWHTYVPTLTASFSNCVYIILYQNKYYVRLLLKLFLYFPYYQVKKYYVHQLLKLILFSISPCLSAHLGTHLVCLLLKLLCLPALCTLFGCVHHLLFLALHISQFVLGLFGLPMVLLVCLHCLKNINQLDECFC